MKWILRPGPAGVGKESGHGFELHATRGDGRGHFRASIGVPIGLSPALARSASRSQDETLRLGCCYYPEHWPEPMWRRDAAEMAARGIGRVRIGEFAWTRMEPDPGRFDWGWLDRVVDLLGAAGLGVVLGTPTATPPAWLVERHPEILPVGTDGRTRGFGSRRYYSFSSLPYRAECARIAAAMGERYGRHEAVVGWQIDNEYGCHGTTLSYGPADLRAWRAWLRERYGTVARLNEAWGSVVWSQEVGSFDQVGFPIATPADPSPAALLDQRRFASDQIRAFHLAQVEVIRPRSPGRFVTTNFMGDFTDFDQFLLGDTIDFPTWDSYPLGLAAGRDEPQWDRTGSPDVTGWNHDLMRAINPAPFWIMEQQPGPVNWARYNPCPRRVWCGCGRGRRLHTGPRRSATSVGARAGSARRRCTPGSTAPTARSRPAVGKPRRLLARSTWWGGFPIRLAAMWPWCSTTRRCG